jgi:hypothetical protein
MQRFVAELTHLIDKGLFDGAWKIESAALHSAVKVDFGFQGRRVSATVHSEPCDQWKAESFRKTFSIVVRRLDGTCNIRWL